MKTAFLWGTIFGILQAIITIIVSILYSSPDILTLACGGLLASFALTLVCSAIAAARANKFSIGFLAGMIATVYDLLSSVIGYFINPATMQGGWIVVAISWVITIVMAAVISGGGAAAAVFLYRKLAKPSDKMS